MPPEGINEPPEQEQAEDYSSWDTLPSDPELEDPLQQLYALIERDLGMGHVHESD
jgi:hypothetical protein